MANYKEISIKDNMPTVATALALLEQELKNSKSNKDVALKIIHGYGSSGKGGRIRTALRKQLDVEVEKNRIPNYICGEDFSIFDSATRTLLQKCPQLRGDTDLDFQNHGMTIVVLSR